MKLIFSLPVHALSLFLLMPFAAFSQGFTCGQTMMDARDSTTYATVQIGNQCWMAENLRYLPSVTGPNPGGLWQPNYYVYAYNGTNVSAAKQHPNYSLYGVLYNWYAAMNGDSSLSSWLNPSNVQGVCPSGWHLPSRFEWEDLTAAVGGGLTAGIALKDTGTSLWLNNTGATNSAGFNGRPGGMRFSGTGNIFANKGTNAYFWTTSGNNGINRSYKWIMNHIDNVVSGDWELWYMGLSVRCIKDAGVPTGRIDMPGKERLWLYPNPVMQNLRIHAEEELHGQPFFISDCTGRTVYQGVMQTGTHEADVSSLSPGLYFLRTGHANNLSGRFIKQ